MGGKKRKKGKVDGRKGEVGEGGESRGSGKDG
jgi:hypothetical protein